MTTRIALAASIAALVLAAPRARAHDGERFRPPPPAPYQPPPAAVPYVPSPVPPPALGPPVEPARWGGWSGHELRIALERIERDRARFYATWNGNPWSQRRFEDWYAWRHAELDRRLAWLERGHGHGHCRFD